MSKSPNNTPNDLSVLKSNARVHPLTPQAPYHSVSVRSRTTHCRISIRATKPLPDPLLPAALPPAPSDWVETRHGARACRCAHFALTAPSLFDAWRRVADDLRYGAGRPDVSGVFAGAGESYDVAEALGAAALVASMGLRVGFPECFDELAMEIGAKPRPEPDPVRVLGYPYQDYDTDFSWFLIMNNIRW